MGLFCLTDEAAGADSEVVVIVASGELDYAASPQLKAHIQSHLKGGDRRLVLDLSGVTFIDSTAIGVLVGAVARLRDAGSGSLVVVCETKNERVLRIFDIAGVATAIPLYGSREEARAAATMAWLLDAPPWVGQAGEGAHAGEPHGADQAAGPEAARRYAYDARQTAATVANRRTDGNGGLSSEHEVDELA